MDIQQTSGDSSYTHQPKTLLFVLTGPSGVGKDAVLDRLKQTDIELEYIITAVTREPRENEVNHRDYHFLSREAFQDLIDTDGLLEWANVYGNLYGVPAKDVEDALMDGKDVMVKVDIQGVANILRKKPDAVTIFLVPPSLDELYDRLKNRKTDSGKSLELRMQTAVEEMNRITTCDYAVVNADGQIDKAVADIIAIITAEKCRVNN